jgi:hypothetical protein
VQTVCNHPQQIIDPQWQIADRQVRKFLPPQCNYTELEQSIHPLTLERDEARRNPAAPGTDEELSQELADFTHDAQQSGEEVRSFRMQ